MGKRTVGVVAFDESTHTYTLDGVSVPSVTTILKDLGLMPTYPPDPIYRARGLAVHRATELYDLGRLGKVDERIEGYVQAWIGFLAATQFSPTLSEYRTACPTFRYAGTVDRYGVIQGKAAVVDIKTGAPAEAAALQTAGYARLLTSEHYPVDRRMTVQLSGDGTYRVKEYEDHAGDDRRFLYALNLSHWRKEHGIR